MVTHLGTFLGTELGTDLGTFQDGAVTFDASKLYALNAFSGTDYYATQVGGGEAGDAAGFGALVLIRLSALSGVARYLFNRSNAGNAGWLVWIDSTNVVKFFCVSGAGAGISSPGFQLTASDVGRVIAIAVQHDGTKARLFINRTQAVDGTAITGYTALALRTTMSGTSASPTTNPATGVQELAWLTFLGTPTTAHLLALFDAIRPCGGDMPSKAAAEAAMPGTTVTHRWSLKEVLAAANLPVVDGQAAPATIPDSVTAATVDAMTKTGAPTVKVIDPTTPKLWSYETSPILYGGSAWADAALYECPTYLGDSNTQSFWAAAFFLLTSQSVASRGRDLFGTIASTPSRGFTLRTNLTNTTMNILAIDNAATGRAAPATTLATTDVGKLHLLVGVWDVPALKLRTYAKRAEVSTGTAVTGYSPYAAGGMRIGRGSFQAADTSCDGIVIYGVAAGLGLPTLAQIQQQFDDTMANERIAGIPGLTNLRIDLDADARANTNALPATLTDRQSGTYNFARTGSITTTPQYARAFAW